MQNTLSKDNPMTDRPSPLTWRLPKALLIGGILAGPLYLAVGLLQAFTRSGFDITRHSLSLLSNGDLGWIHITNFVVTGLLTIAGAVGIRQTLRPGLGSKWAPLLIGIYGVSLIGAGIFKADPALGFPSGTPADANTISTQGLLHFAVGGIGFLALIAACFVLARRFATRSQRGWMTFSMITGIVFFAAFVGIASGQGNPWTILGFWIGVIVAWSWLSALSARLLSGSAESSEHENV